jgi:hypothetical protein
MILLSFYPSFDALHIWEICIGYNALEVWPLVSIDRTNLEAEMVEAGFNKGFVSGGDVCQANWTSADGFHRAQSHYSSLEVCIY